jgi:hypothetical protein
MAVEKISADAHPAATDPVPIFFPSADGTDVLTVAVGIFLVLTVLAVGLLFLRLHTLPERIAHKRQKFQFEIVAVLGLLALFTHIHLFWVAGLILALVELPDFTGVFGRMASALGEIATNTRREVKLKEDFRSRYAGSSLEAGEKDTVKVKEGLTDA